MKTLGRLLTVLAISMAMGLGVRWAAQRYFIRSLAERVSEPGRASSLLLPELAKIGPDGLAPLAEASSSLHRRVAQPARQQIDRLVRRWEQLDTESSTKSDQASHNALRLKLAEELLTRAGRFSPAGQTWLASVAARLLQSSEQSTDQRLILACDELLDAARRRSEVLDQVTPIPQVVISGPAADEEARSTIVASEPQALWQQPSTQPDASSITQPSIATPNTPATPIGQTPIASTEVGSGERQPLAWSPEPAQAAPAAEFTPPASASPLPWTTPSTQPSLVDNSASWPTRITEPCYLTTTTPVAMATVAAMPDRWVIAEGLRTDNAWLRAAIIARGFGVATREHLTSCVAPSESERMRLVDELLAGRSSAAARLLLLLASDSSPSVRLRAISALGASGNRQLAEAAWRMAVHDPNPRVAAVANEIRRY